VNADEEKMQLKEFAERWKRLGPILEQIRDDEIRNADTRLFIKSTAGLIENFFKTNQSRSSSGLVEQQYWFSRTRG
jgi:hypothetical protein